MPRGLLHSPAAPSPSLPSCTGQVLAYGDQQLGCQGPQGPEPRAPSGVAAGDGGRRLESTPTERTAQNAGRDQGSSGGAAAGLTHAPGPARPPDNLRHLFLPCSLPAQESKCRNGMRWPTRGPHAHPRPGRDSQTLWLAGLTPQQEGEPVVRELLGGGVRLPPTEEVGALCSHPSNTSSRP